MVRTPSPSSSQPARRSPPPLASSRPRLLGARPQGLGLEVAFRLGPVLRLAAGLGPPPKVDLVGARPDVVLGGFAGRAVFLASVSKDRVPGRRAEVLPSRGSGVGSCHLFSKRARRYGTLSFRTCAVLRQPLWGLCRAR